MRKIFNLLFISLAAVFYSACSSQETDLFDHSSANRISAALQQYKDVLTSAPSGWLMQYYPSATQKFGGYNVLVSFANDGSVTVSSDRFASGEKAVSTYALTQSAGPIVSFDSYNKVMHFFSDPANPAGIGTKGKGMEGDFEFTVMEASKDKIVLKGKKTESEAILTPLAPGTSWSEYIEKVKKAEADMTFGSYEYKAGEVTAAVTVSYHLFSMTYEENGATVTKKVPFIVTPKGYRFYSPLDIGGVSVDELTYKGAEDNYRFLSADGKAALRGIVLPLNKVLTSTTLWFFSYSGLGALGKSNWDLAIPALWSQEGEELVYLYFSGGNKLTFRSGTYVGVFNCKSTLVDNNKITVSLESYADSNAQYYYTRVPNFSGIVNILVGSYTLTADDLKNPTKITLQDVARPTNSMMLSRTQINYPARN